MLWFPGVATDDARPDLPPAAEEAAGGVGAAPRLHEGQRQDAPGGRRRINITLSERRYIF